MTDTNIPVTLSLLDDVSRIRQLILRLKLLPSLMRRHVEEEILDVVPIQSELLQKERTTFLGDASLDDLLSSNQWSINDLDVHLSLPIALRRFSEQRFGPGLEEAFLSSNGAHDQIIYSVLRVRNAGLANELWIRLEEHEATFAELATRFGEGPEASRKGVMGPVAIGSVVPVELAVLLRKLRAGEVHPPVYLGEWVVLLRLEQLTPARFDDKMRDFLLDQQLNSFIDSRIQMHLSGQSVDPLDFDITQ